MEDILAIFIFVCFLGAILCGIGILICNGMLIRNKKVAEYRIKILHESKWEDGIFIPYTYLPSYDEMMKRWWVRDFDVFLKEAETKIKNRGN